MTAPVDLSPSAHRGNVEANAFRLQGIAAGLFGALLLAGWFLYLDTIRGHALFTPTLLAAAMLGTVTPDTAAELRGSLPMTLLFTALHGAVFALIGLGAAEVLLRFGRVRSRALIGLLVFAVLCAAFFAFALNVTAVGPNAIPVRDALIGNALATFGLTLYLARNLPREARTRDGAAVSSGARA